MQTRRADRDKLRDAFAIVGPDFDVFAEERCLPRRQINEKTGIFWSARSLLPLYEKELAPAIQIADEAG